MYNVLWSLIVSTNMFDCLHVMVIHIFFGIILQMSRQIAARVRNDEKVILPWKFMTLRNEKPRHHGDNDQFKVFLKRPRNTLRRTLEPQCMRDGILRALIWLRPYQWKTFTSESRKGSLRPLLCLPLNGCVINFSRGADEKGPHYPQCEDCTEPLVPKRLSAK